MELHVTMTQQLGRKPVSNPLDEQVGGTHYKDQGIQPFEITYANFGYEGIRASVYTKVNKYLTRTKGDHKENLEKAIHCLQIQLELLDRSKNKKFSVIP